MLYMHLFCIHHLSLIKNWRSVWEDTFRSWGRALFVLRLDSCQKMDMGGATKWRSRNFTTSSMNRFWECKAEFRCDVFFEVFEVNRSFSWAQSEEIWRDTLMLAFQMPNGSSPQRWWKGLADQLNSWFELLPKSRSKKYSKREQVKFMATEFMTRLDYIAYVEIPAHHHFYPEAP